MPPRSDLLRATTNTARKMPALARDELFSDVKNQED
jgi:hypothetical protein